MAINKMPTPSPSPGSLQCEGAQDAVTGEAIPRRYAVAITQDWGNGPLRTCLDLRTLNEMFSRHQYFNPEFGAQKIWDAANKAKIEARLAQLTKTKTFSFALKIRVDQTVDGHAIHDMKKRALAISLKVFDFKQDEPEQYVLNWHINHLKQEFMRIFLIGDFGPHSKAELDGALYPKGTSTLPKRVSSVISVVTASILDILDKVETRDFDIHHGSGFEIEDERTKGSSSNLIRVQSTLSLKVL
jgi:hypothetical protein